MNKERYIIELEKDINDVLDDYTLINFKNQAFAWRLKADFNRTFSEEYLWNRALFLSSRSCMILKSNNESQLAMIALKESAEIYEYLSDLENIELKYDRSFLSILSSLCYCISGYQANSYCIANHIVEYQLENDSQDINITSDNFIIKQIALVLTNKFSYSNYLISSCQLEQDLGLSLFISSMKSWYNNILFLLDTNYLSNIYKTYRCYLDDGNVYISQLLLLLEARIKLYKQRSIWENLKQNDYIYQDALWKKYIKLLTNDIYTQSNINDIEARKSKCEFWISQLRALEGGLLKDENNNFVVQMPTSAGKTFIAEIAILNRLIANPDKKCIYVAPFRALTGEKEIELNQYLSKLGFTVSSLTGSYEIDEFQDVLLDETDVLVATPEKVDLLLRLNPDFFNLVSFVVVDEGHIIGDVSTRASLLEMLIIRLKIKTPSLGFLFISAVMPSHNANEYALWLNNDENSVLRSLLFNDSNISEEWEPTRKLIGQFSWLNNSGTIRFQNVVTEDENTKVQSGAFIPSFIKHKEFAGAYPIKKNKSQTAAALAFKLSAEGSTLVFCAQVQRIKSVANAFINLIEALQPCDLPERFSTNTNTESYHYAMIWYGSESFVTNAIKYRVGIHYGDMPEQVRKSVEKDFRSGTLSVLLSTNTIGQGLNFPIKNLIFYETQIGRRNDKNIYIQYRDFWNIVGRAGRAGKETEGKIIFIINTSTDKKLYHKFTNKSNIEEANSLIFKVLKSLIDKRISEETFKKYTSILTEPYLIDLLSEEMLGNDLSIIIENVINNSLFKVQLAKHNIDISPLRNRFVAICNDIKNDLSPQQIIAYSKTGFCKDTSKIFENYIHQEIDDILNSLISDDFENLLWHFIQIVSKNQISEFIDTKLYSLGLSHEESFNIVTKWINGDSIDEIKSYWSRIHNDETKLHVFMSVALYYLYPWGMTSFLTITMLVLNIDKEGLLENTKNVSSYLKFGLNNSIACLARSLGIKNREVALVLASKSNTSNNKLFIRWLSNLTLNEIKRFGFSVFDEMNLLEVALKLSPHSYRTIPQEFIFIAKGTFFNDSWWQISKEISINDILYLQRDYSNKSDPYAVQITFNGKPFGFVPREYSKWISSEIDISGVNFSAYVDDIIEGKNYNQIQVVLTPS